MKILKRGGCIQNYVFKLINRATVDKPTLSKETVANIRNDDTKAFISTQLVKEDTILNDNDSNDEPLPLHDELEQEHS